MRPAEQEISLFQSWHSTVLQPLSYTCFQQLSEKTNLFKISKRFFLPIIFSASSLDSLAPEVHPRPVVGAALHPRLGTDVQVALIHRGARVPGDPWDWWLAGVGSSYRLVIRGKSWPHGTEPGGGRIVICNGWLPLLGGQGRLGPLFNISCKTCGFSPRSNFRRKSNPQVALQKSKPYRQSEGCQVRFPSSVCTRQVLLGPAAKILWAIIGPL